MLLYTKKFNRIDAKKLINHKFYQNDAQFFWENNKSNEVIAGFGCIEQLEILNHSDLDSIQLKIDEKLKSIHDITKIAYVKPKFFGGYSFDLEIKREQTWKNFPRGYFILPKCIITSNPNNTFITLIKKTNNSNTQIFNDEINEIYKGLIDSEPIYQIAKNEIKDISNTTKTDYLDAINGILNQIQSGAVKKVVLSRSKKLKLKEEFQLFSLMQKLRKSYPECINFYIKLPQRGIFLGSTPERLIEKNELFIKTEAIAGTIERGINKKTDKLFEDELRNDPKSLEEQELVVKEIKNILYPKLSNIHISKKPNILKLKNVQHLISNIRGELKNDIHILELIKNMHPTPAVSGYPIKKANQLISKYEKHDRGWYSGPIGWIDSSGNGDFCVGLRSAFINNDSINLFSGGGIVLNSDPEKEWDETELKLKSILEIIERNNVN